MQMASPFAMRFLFAQRSRIWVYDALQHKSLQGRASAEPGRSLQAAQRRANAAHQIVTEPMGNGVAR